MRFVKNREAHRRSFTYFITAVFIVANIVTLFPITTASAAECDEDFYSSNDIVFYNACEASCSPNDDPFALQGATIIEKIWNFYAGKGLKSVAIAGIMGNFSQESAFDPAVKQNQTTDAIPSEGDGKTGYGLAQWTSKGRQAGLFTKMNEAGLSKYYGEGWGASEANRTIPTKDLNKLLSVELNYSWDGDSTSIKSLVSALNAAPSVEGDDGSTVLFHNSYEVSADNAEAIQERISDAQEIFQKYGKDNVIDATACGVGVLGGVSSVEDAIPWAKKFVADTIAVHNPAQSEELNEVIGAFHVIHRFFRSPSTTAGFCWKAVDCGQCVAVSGWFAITQTQDNSFLNAGGRRIVGRYEAAGKPTGDTPRPFSIFSALYGTDGHTGVVLGVLDNGDVITVEANLNYTGRVSIWQGNMNDRYINKGIPVTYAYFDDRLANDAAAAFGGGSNE